MVFGTRLDPVLSASEAQSLLEIRFYSQSPDKRVQCILPLRNQPTTRLSLCFIGGSMVVVFLVVLGAPADKHRLILLRYRLCFGQNQFCGFVGQVCVEIC